MPLIESSDSCTATSCSARRLHCENLTLSPERLHAAVMLLGLFLNWQSGTGNHPSHTVTHQCKLQPQLPLWLGHSVKRTKEKDEKKRRLGDVNLSFTWKTDRLLTEEAAGVLEEESMFPRCCSGSARGWWQLGLGQRNTVCQSALLYYCST